ncbi:MAG: class I SAM-dependent methyltransferase [Gammaproteobacteria bacterium]
MLKDLSHNLRLTPSQDERNRQEFVASLRHHILDHMATSMRNHYEQRVRPAFERANGRPPVDGNEVHDAMQAERYFRFYSSIRYNAQEMVFRSVIPVVDRNLEQLNARARAEPGNFIPDPDLAVPANVANIDVHLSPGSYHSEYDVDDVSAGAIYDNSINVFAFSQMGRDVDDVGHSFANYVRLAWPDFKPADILDAGCTVGHNTLPWAKTFPAAAVTGIDVSPGVVRYAAARACSFGLPVRFMQMNATQLSFPDESFDVVFSSMFLHELPLRDIRAYFREAFRVLKPGGLFLNMELPPNDRMEPYDGFYLDWDSYYNKEPWYKRFRDQNFRQLCTAAGFAGDRFVEAVVPRYTYTPLAEFEAAVRQSLGRDAQFDNRTGRLSEDLRWYGFGAWKQGGKS